MKKGSYGIFEKKCLTSRTIEILRLIYEKDGMLCTGSCCRQKKEHLHCRQIGRDLGMGFSAVWEHLNFLLQEGLVERKRIGDGPVNFMLTSQGEKVLFAAAGGKESPFS